MHLYLCQARGEHQANRKGSVLRQRRPSRQLRPSNSGEDCDPPLRHRYRNDAREQDRAQSAGIKRRGHAGAFSESSATEAPCGSHPQPGEIRRPLSARLPGRCPSHSAQSSHQPVRLEHRCTLVELVRSINPAHFILRHLRLEDEHGG